MPGARPKPRWAGCVTGRRAVRVGKGTAVGVVCSWTGEGFSTSATGGGAAGAVRPVAVRRVGVRPVAVRRVGV